MENILVSVVITIYNGESNINKMIDCVINQSYRNLEIICINDGSIDNTKEFLENYKIIDNRIDCFHIKNVGSANARLIGFRKAKGEYIIFLDVDDTIEHNMIESMLRSALDNESDMVVCGFDRRYEDGVVFSTELANKRNNIKKNNKYDMAFINTALWNKLFKKSLIPTYIKIPRITQGDDLGFLIMIYKNINNVSFVDKAFYHYVVYESSLMSTVNINNFLVLVKHIKSVAKKLKGVEFDIVILMAYICLCNSYLLRINKEYPTTTKIAIKILRKLFLTDIKNSFKSGVFIFKNVKKYKVKGIGLYFSSVFFKLNIFKLYLYLFKILKKVFKLSW